MKNTASFLHDTFSSLKIRNYRLYFTGQAISVSGTFMQAVAQAWLVLKITNSGTALGLVTALQFLPVLLLGPWGGVIADRYNKRKLLFVTQTVFSLQAIILGILVIIGLVQLWMVAVLAFIYGLVNVVDSPTRQTFVPEMVGNENVRNAVTLYSSLVNLARVIGPVIAAVLIATVGLGMCFIVNGLSYSAIIILLYIMDTGQLLITEKAIRKSGQMIEGLRYILSTPVLRITLLMMAFIGTFTYEFQVSLPLLAEFTFHGDAGTYAFLMSSQGVGSIIGGIILAGQKRVSVRSLTISAFLFGASTLLASFMPGLILSAIIIFVVGFFSINVLSLGNTILQLGSTPQMRGRVMAYWAMAFLGSTAIGGPIIGWVGENIGPRWGLGIGGVAAIIASVIGIVAIRDLKGEVTGEESVRAEIAESEERRVL